MKKSWRLTKYLFNKFSTGRKKNHKWLTNSWEFVYILAKQCRSPFNLTNFLPQKSNSAIFEIFAKSFSSKTCWNTLYLYSWSSQSVVPTRNQLYNLFIIAWNIFESTLQRWIGWWTPPLILWMNNLWNVKRPIIQVIRCLMRGLIISKVCNLCANLLFCGIIRETFTVLPL